MTAEAVTRTSPRGASAPTRKRFALTGPSVRFDPRTHAVRRDLADVRLADQVFAPHYAAPLPRILSRAAPLMTAGEIGAGVIFHLDAGEPFEVLELAGGYAWGVAPEHGVVGYVDADALAPA